MRETVRVAPTDETETDTGTDPDRGGDPDSAAGGPEGGAAGSPPPPARTVPSGASDRMPRWLPRAMVLALALVACFQLGSWAFHQLIGLLLNILIAFFLALAIEPAVSRMAARGMRRGLA